MWWNNWRRMRPWGAHFIRVQEIWEKIWASEKHMFIIYIYIDTHIYIYIDTHIYIYVIYTGNGKKKEGW